MSKNIILKTLNEINNFQKIISKAIIRNEYQSSFLILSNEIILDFEALRKYLIENSINEFGTNEISN